MELLLTLHLHRRVGTSLVDESQIPRGLGIVDPDETDVSLESGSVDIIEHLRRHHKNLLCIVFGLGDPAVELIGGGDDIANSNVVLILK